LADWLDCVPVVLEALLVHLELTALVLGTAAGETFETCHNRLGGGHMLATVAHNLDIIGLYWRLVANCCVSCSMENGDKNAERLEMAAAKEGNHTHVAVDIDWCVPQIDCLCQWQVVYHYPEILNCHHGADASHIGHPVEPYSLTLVEIPSLTWSVNKHGGNLLYMHNVMKNKSEHG
jgi:hypothetical protein